MSKRNYAVLGAGRQGKAAAFDLARFGNSAKVFLADIDASAAENAAIELDRLLGQAVIEPLWLDVADEKKVLRALREVDGFVSAVHFDLNLALTELAIKAQCHMVDLGGNTAVVIKQQGLDRAAKAAGVRIIPDCGMAPGFDVNLAHHAMTKIRYPCGVEIYCGGIPQCPIPPLGYHFPFSVKGLVNECSGFADVIQGGNITQRSCLFSIGQILIPEIGMLEATHTSGGLSTAPWSFQWEHPSLETLEYQTLRYPGHWSILQKLAREGKLESGLEELARITPQDLRDLGVIHVRCSGLNEDFAPTTVILEVIDRYDDTTKFTAMQRLTGFHASIMLIIATEKLTGGGVHRVELIDSKMVIDEFAKRGIITRETHATHRKK